MFAIVGKENIQYQRFVIFCVWREFNWHSFEVEHIRSLSSQFRGVQKKTGMNNNTLNTTVFWQKSRRTWKILLGKTLSRWSSKIKNGYIRIVIESSVICEKFFLSRVSCHEIIQLLKVIPSCKNPSQSPLQHEWSQYNHGISQHLSKIIMLTHTHYKQQLL